MLTHVESLYLGGSNLTALVDANVLAGLTNISGSSGSEIVTDEAAADLTGKSASGVTFESTNAIGTTFSVDSSSMAFLIYGGPGSDTIETSSFAFTAAERDAIFASASIETIIDTSGSHPAPAPDPNVFKLTPGTDTLAPTAANLTINGNAVTLNPTDNLDGGDGTDSLVLYGAGTFDLNALAGFADIEEVQLVNLTGSNATLYLRNGTTSAVTTIGGGPTQVFLQNTAAASSIQGGDGYNDVRLYDTSTAGLSMSEMAAVT